MSSLNIITKRIPLPDGREIIIETGKLAKQADGSAVVRLGNTMLLATVVSAKDAKEGVDFMPLSVDYQEKFAAAGRIPGGFLRREGRLSDHEILISRLIDRVLRPLFPDDYHADTQVNVVLISSDESVQADALAALAASAALAVSDIPFNGPISEVRIISTNGKFTINPTPEQIEGAEMDLIVGASEENILMVEGEMNEVQESLVLEALKVAHETIIVQCKALKEFTIAAGKTQKREYSHEKNDDTLREKLNKLLYDKVYEVAKLKNPSKKERGAAFKQIIKDYIAALPADHTEDLSLIAKYYHDVEKAAIRNMVMDERYRLDGRALDQIRPIWTEIDYLPSAHGSAIFTRGETQSLTTVTLGTKLDEQMIDSATWEGTRKFMLHYNFPGFSTGEVKPNRGPGRREVGHGNLAYRALQKVLPPPAENPYTVRIVSDILESNGSSSMATVCAGSLALMDAGFPVKSAVSGIAMGFISDPTNPKRYAVLSDILGDEDHLGDMDFKLTGTEKGITACQMDMKVEGLSYEVLAQALEQARKGRLHIMNEMKKTIGEPRLDLKAHAPRSTSIQIAREFIGAVIGPGGKIVQDIQKQSGATVIIEEIAGGGLVSIYAKDRVAMDKAVSMVKAIVTEPEVNEEYNGKVKSIQPFGAFVEFMPGKEGLLHISEIKWERLETMDGVMEIGEEVKVKLIEVDKKTGKYRLSRKALLPRPEGMPERSGDRKPRENGERPQRQREPQSND